MSTRGARRPASAHRVGIRSRARGGRLDEGSLLDQLRHVQPDVVVVDCDREVELAHLFIELELDSLVDA
jgi:hypothetical protein